MGGGFSPVKFAGKDGATPVMSVQKQIGSALEEKYFALRDYLHQFENMAVAFSGGVDSSLLLKVVHDALDRCVLAITAKTPTFPEREIAETRVFCKDASIRHIVFNSLACTGDTFEENPPDRCYFCKKTLLSEMSDIAHTHGISVVAEGSNLDDENDYRPGLVAVEESDVISPLRQLKFTKDDIRALAHYLDLSMWNKPSFACLATRIPYGQRITAAGLSCIDAAEQEVIDLGFDQVRVRCDNDNASIEVEPAEIARLEQLCNEKHVFQKLKELGFREVTINPEGYVPKNLKRT